MALLQDFELRLGRRYLDKFLITVQKDDGTSVKTSEDNSHQISPHLECNVNSSKPKIDPNCTSALDDSSCEHEGPDEYLLESASDFQVVDTFRYFYPQERDAFTCWNTHVNARATNYGTRIDYIFCDELFLPFLEDSAVLSDVMGSDHCPVAVKISGEVIPSAKLPNMCTKFFPEFKGSQQKLSSYFQPVSSICDTKSKMSDMQPQFGSKRKLNDPKPKSVSQKKSSSDKQIKLDSFFAAKPKDKERNLNGLAKFDTNSEKHRVYLNEKTSPLCIEKHFSSQSSHYAAPETDCDISKDINSQQLKNEGLGKLTENGSSSQTKNVGWGFLMKGPKPPPLCPGHGEPAALRTVKKKGPNMNRQFYACARGAGREGDPNAQCNFFQWAGKK